MKPSQPAPRAASDSATRGAAKSSANPNPAAPLRKPHWWRRVSLVSTLLLLGLLGFVYFSTRSVPAWYHPAAIDTARLSDDKRDLTNLLDAIGGALNGERTAEIVLDEAQLNRWLAARNEMPLPAEWSYDVNGIEKPQINLLGDGNLRVAATVQRGSSDYVLACLVHLDLVEGRLQLTPTDVTLGGLSLPRIVLDWATKQAAARAPGKQVLDLSHGVELPARGTWPNGKRRFSLAAIEVSPGQIKLQLKPE